MKIIEFIRNKTSQFAEKGLLGYLMALFFFYFYGHRRHLTALVNIIKRLFLGNIIN